MICLITYKIGMKDIALISFKMHLHSLFFCLDDYGGHNNNNSNNNNNNNKQYL